MSRPRLSSGELQSYYDRICSHPEEAPSIVHRDGFRYPAVSDLLAHRIFWKYRGNGIFFRVETSSPGTMNPTYTPLWAVLGPTKESEHVDKKSMVFEEPVVGDPCILYQVTPAINGLDGSQKRDLVAACRIHAIYKRTPRSRVALVIVSGLCTMTVSAAAQTLVKQRGTIHALFTRQRFEQTGPPIVRPLGQE